MYKILKKEQFFSKNNLDKEKSLLKWRIAQFASIKFGGLYFACDFCLKKEVGLDCKVFHRIETDKISGHKYSRKLKDGVYMVVDHIVLCKNCKEYVPKNWFGCRCKKENIEYIRNILR